jgi:uncharacterized protein
MDNPKIYLRATEKTGKGVFTRKPIKRGELVAAFDGQRFDGRFQAWTEDLLSHAIQYGASRWRDSVGLARYLNHSCEPNCGIRGLFQIVAMRDIAAGEELTWDYEMTEKSDWYRLRCRCGSPKCRKVIGHHDRMPAEVRALYKGYLSYWLR